MVTKDDIRPVSYLKSRTKDILEQVNQTHRPVYITQNGEAKAVLIDTDSFDKIQKSMAFLKLLSQSEADIAAGNVKSQEEVFDDIEKMLDETE